MAENTKTEAANKPSFFKQVKAEFRKVIWPDKKRVARQTVAVVIVSVCLGGLIALFDAVIKFGLGLIL